jgi:LysM repeat protein
VDCVRHWMIRFALGVALFGAVENGSAKPTVKASPAKAQPVKAKAQPVKAKAQPVKAKAQPVKAKAQPLKAKAQAVKAKAQPVKAVQVTAQAAKRAGRAPGQPAVRVPAAVPSPRQVPSELLRVGSMSVGRPNTGYLVNAVRMPNDPDWVLTAPSHAYGTQETVDQLKHCLHRVHELFPGSPPVMLGSLSAERGGGLPPHKSHRTGRDADVYFFRSPDAAWNRAAAQDDIDLPRTWALLRCFVTEADVDMVLIDHKVQGWLESYAIAAGEPEDWVLSLFHDRRGAPTAPVRHVPGHVAHMHVRFVSPEARRQAARHYDQLVANGIVAQGVEPMQHKVAKGDTLLRLAKRYGISVETIRANNHLTGSLIRVGQVLTLQRAVELEGAREPVWIPPRRLPTRHVPAAPEALPSDTVTLRGEAEATSDHTGT